MTTAVRPALLPEAVDAVQRAPHHQLPVRPSAEGRHPAEQGAVDLERVATGVPARAEPQPRHQLRDAVQDQEDADRTRLRATGEHELEPDEHQQRDSRRPVAQGRQPTLRGGVTGEPDEPGVQGAQRVDVRPEGAEQQADRDEPDPERHVEHEGRQVVVGARRADQRDRHDEQRQQQHHRPEHGLRDRRVHERLHPSGQRTPGRVAAQPGRAPEQHQREEADEHREARAVQRQRQRDRQVGAAADAVREEGHEALSWKIGRPASCSSTSYAPGRSAVKATSPVPPAGMST